jgi:hypothetical protein
MFSKLLRSVSSLFSSSKAVQNVRRQAQPHLESLEQRDVPSSFATQLQNLKILDYQLAINNVAAARNAVSLFNESAALQDLNNAKYYLGQTAQLVGWQYQDGYESKSQALSDLAIINTAINQVNADQQAVTRYFTASGSLGSLLSWDGQYLGNMPNFYSGANMLP